MCGILGYLGDQPIIFSNNISLDLISHRGPNNQASVSINNFYLGQTRLSIQDLSEAGNQPMYSNDKKFILIFNGEIYNHNELRKNELLGIKFNSSSDTETLLYGLIKEGEQFLNKINGIFSFCFINLTTNDFLIARDQFGVKPLYYYLSETELFFSSELKAINKALPSKSINLGALKNYINFLWSPGKVTPLNEVSKLLPGHLISGNTTKINKLVFRQYYSIPFNGKYISDKTEEEIINLLEDKLLKAVERQLLSDVPVGFFLSGGLDSSLIVAMAKKLHPDKEFNCYTIKTDEITKEGFANDLDYAQKVAKDLKVNLSIIDAKSNILEYFDKVVYHLDEPQADPAPINVYNICKEAKKQGVKVLLGGTAGDDLFTGYRRHRALKIENKLNKIPQPLRVLLKNILNNFNRKNPSIRRLNKLLANTHLSKEERLMGFFDWIDKETLNELFTTKVSNNPHQYFKDLNKQIPKEKSDINRMLFWELNTFLVDHNLNYTDKLSMATGVEVRVPFLDKELVEFSTTIPPELKLKGKETKYILKKVAERYLSKDVIYRPKTGFGAPVREWVLNDMTPLIEKYLNNDTIKRRGIFNPSAVKKLISDNKTGKIDASYTIWSLLAIESWMQQFYD